MSGQRVCLMNAYHDMPAPFSLQVIDVQKSFVNMVPTKVEIALRKTSPMTWAKLEHLQSSSQPRQDQTEKDPMDAEDPEGEQWEESDDSLSWSEEGDEEGEEGAVSK